MTKYFIRIFSIFMIGTVILSGCIGGNNAIVVEKLPLRIGWSLWPGWFPVVIADQKGFFKEHGVDVQLVFYDSTLAQNVGFASGQVDGSTEVLSDLLYDGISNKVKVVLITDNSNGADQLVASADIHSINDLRGKRIGIGEGTFSELWIREVLKENNIPLSDVTFVNMPPENIPGAIPNTVDAGHTFEPYASQARAKGFITVFDSSTTPGLVVDVLAFNRKTIVERPQDVKAFVLAWYEAEEWWKKNPEEGNALIAKATGLKVEDITLEGVKLFDQTANLASFIKGKDSTSLYFTTQKLTDQLISLGAVSNPVKVDDILDPSFLQ